MHGMEPYTSLLLGLGLANFATLATLATLVTLTYHPCLVTLVNLVNFALGRLTLRACQVQASSPRDGFLQRQDDID